MYKIDGQWYVAQIQGLEVSALDLISQSNRGCIFSYVRLPVSKYKGKQLRKTSIQEHWTPHILIHMSFIPIYKFAHTQWEERKMIKMIKINIVTTEGTSQCTLLIVKAHMIKQRLD